MISEKIFLKNLAKDELTDFVVKLGLEPYRSRQLFHWLYRKNVSDFARMTTLRKEIRERLAGVAELDMIELVSSVSSQIDSTIKFLFALRDGRLVESVYMEEAGRRTICISSQVGCPLNCGFCATGKMGFIRNLTAGEIVDQVLWIERHLGQEATHLVVMGMGEPFLNYDAVLQAAEILSDPEGVAVSKRKITISTSGLVPGIHRFTRERRRFKLAISLNASNDETRIRLMPIAKKYPLRTLLEAVKEYTDRASYRVTFEYLLLAGINDHISDARRLRKLLAEIPCKINLIPYNAIDNRFCPPEQSRIDRFMAELATFPAPVTVRKSKGQEIQAACGQLSTERISKINSPISTSSIHNNPLEL